jgi:polyisoprenyl-teichoic acid--peptidoglycan teichoic acid transferase
MSIPAEILVIQLLGVDTVSPRIGRTDSIFLVFLNLESGAASMVAIPRDLFVYQPGWTMDRINTAYLRGGIELLSLTIEYNLGVRPHHWALAHFDDFEQFINDLGGITVPVSDPLPDDCGGIPPGFFHMDGVQALCYVRERNTTSDVARSRRQQEVLMVIFERLLSLDALRHLPEWFDRYRHSVKTSLDLRDLIGLVPTVLKFREAGLQSFQIAWDETTSWQVPQTGARVLLPRRERISNVLDKAVEVVLTPVPTSAALATQIAELTATTTPPLGETPAPLENPAAEPTWIESIGTGLPAPTEEDTSVDRVASPTP